MIGLKIQVNGQTIKIAYPDEKGFLLGCVTTSIDNDNINNMKRTHWWAGKVDLKLLELNDEITFEVIELHGNQGPNPVAVGKVI